MFLKRVVIKMSSLNKINQEQKNAMAEYMSRHPDLAKNILPNCQQGKATSIRLWQQLTENLNSLGPPIKDIKGWRKTYADQKFQIKSKLSFNKFSKMKTGGGRFEEKVLTVADEQILAAAGIDVAVEGISVQSFGASTPKICTPTAIGQTIKNLCTTPTPTSTSIHPSTSSSSITNEPSTSFKISANDDLSDAEFFPAKYKKNTQKHDTKELLLREKIKVETNFHESISNKLDRLLEIEERNIKVQERLLQIKEEKHKGCQELQAIDIKIKTLQLENLGRGN